MRLAVHRRHSRDHCRAPFRGGVLLFTHGYTATRARLHMRVRKAFATGTRAIFEGRKGASRQSGGV